MRQAIAQLLSNLRVRLVLFLLLAVIPLFLLTLQAGFEQREQAALQAQSDALRLARFAAVNQELLLENTRGFLLALAHLPDLNPENLNDCPELFSRLLITHYPFYSGFYLADLEGNLVCNTPGEIPKIKTCDHYNELVDSRDFVISSYHLCKNSGKGVISLGYPVIDEATNQTVAVVNAGIDLAWFNALAADMKLPSGSTLVVFDQDGTILVHYPDPEYWVGASMPDDVMTALMLDQLEGTTQGAGLDGIPRLYAYTPLWRGEDGKGEVILSIGIPKEVAFADANQSMRNNLLVLALVTAIAINAAWFLGEVFILRPTKTLVDTTQRLAQGDLSARTQLTYSQGELGTLAFSIDNLADALNRREAEQVQAQNEIREYAGELERRNHELRDFVNIASHDMQEPLRKIQIFSDLLQNRYAESLDERGHYYLASVNTAAKRMQHLIMDLLQYSRVTRASKHFTDVNLEKVLEQVLADLEAQIQVVQAQIEVKAMPTIQADETLMHQLFQNLISNAIKFHAPGQQPVVTVSAKQNSQYFPVCQISVSDNGIGFDEKYLERIFQPFECLHSRQEYEGTGMGLAICRKIVEHHQGTISAQSTPGQGATFTVTLPLHQIKEEHA
jgi:signal transduction histidine kinase